MVKNSSSGSSNRKYRSDLSPQGSNDHGPNSSGPAEESKPPGAEVGPRLIVVTTPIVTLAIWATGGVHFG